MIPFVVFSMRRAWQGFWRNALMSLAATLTMVLMLSLLAGFFILQNVLLASLAFVEDDPDDEEEEEDAGEPPEA